MKLPERYGHPDPEDNDRTPIEMPLGYMRPTPLQDLIANMVRQAVSAEKNEEFETAQEADDFDVGDGELLDLSPYSLSDVQEEEPLGDPEADDAPPQGPPPEPEPEPDPPAPADPAAG